MKPFVFSVWREKWLGQKLAHPTSFLRKVNGVIHIGANIGQERFRYAEYDLRVAWIEPIPDVFKQLSDNLKPFPKQRAYRYLLAAEDAREYTFHITDNDGASSSILPLAKHRDMWPGVGCAKEIKICGTTLGTYIEKEQIRLADYQAIVLDTQGSELMILKGASRLLPNFRFIQVEVADFESYFGGCQIGEMDEFMREHGFRERKRKRMRFVRGVGSYYDVTYEKL
ncbi:MAG: FkbM family methyltransferase [Candidatus Acidiferrum sp.]|jgi:FkbM family methyltransferase